MAEAFIGKWRLTSSEKYDEYMIAIGVGQVTRKMSNAATPINTISMDGVGQVTRKMSNAATPINTISMDGELIKISTSTTFKNTEIMFKLGEEFNETTADGREVKSLVTLDGNKLIHVQKWDDKETSLVREVNGDSLTLVRWDSI
ncbi:fatty acid-binding protein, heart [Silurus meridionalis]|nr:fatty acid-binding protein, heart [Silurus meridionalis]